MAERYRCVKSPKSVICRCNKEIPAKTYRIEEQRGKGFLIYCLKCGENLLLSRRVMHKQRLALCNNVLRKLRSKHKDRVIQRLV